jgi:hypothetical protein
MPVRHTFVRRFAGADPGVSAEGASSVPCFITEMDRVRWHGRERDALGEESALVRGP